MLMKKSFVLFFILFNLILFNQSVLAEDNPVAKIGFNTYSSLQDAINSANDKDEIVLLKDTYENLIINREGVVLSLNLNSNSIDGQKNGSVLRIYKGTINITNGTIKNGLVNRVIGKDQLSSGGGIYIGDESSAYAPNDAEVNLSGVTIKDNQAYYGAGIALFGGKLTIDNTRIISNQVDYQGGGIYVSNMASPLSNSEIQLENTFVNDNTLLDSDGNGAGVYLTCKLTAKKSYFNNNDKKEDNKTSSNSSVIFVTGSSGNLVLNNSFVQDNKNFAHTINLYNGQSYFNNCLINGNSATITGGIYHSDGSLTIENTVIKNNASTISSEGAGGLYLKCGSGTKRFEMIKGAVYGNSSISEAKDVFIPKKNYDNYSLVKANEMEDEDYNFTDFIWRLPDGNALDEIYLNQRYTEALSLTAFNNEKRYIARYNGKDFYSLQAALDAAEEEGNSDIAYISLIAGEGKNQENLLTFSSEPLTINIPVEINLNGRTITITRNSELFTVTENGSLTLSGEGTINGIIYLENKNPLILKSDFNPTGTLNIKINEEIAKKFNNPNVNNDIETFKVVENESNLKTSSFNIINVDYPHSGLETTDNDIFLKNQVIKGTFVNQSNSENGNGTFENPYNNLQDAISNSNSNLFLIGTYVIYSGEDITLSSSDKVISIERFSLTENVNKQNMIEIKNKGKLTLSNITLDGKSNTPIESKSNTEENLYKNCGSIINVNSGGELILESGSTLKNNDISQTEISSINNDFSTYISRYGGAIYSSGEVIMKNGIIENCSAFLGGGVALFNSKLNMTGGEILANHAVQTPTRENIESSGGGVCLIGNSQMEMSGGKISGNTATTGGGISLGTGNYSFTMTNPKDNLIMKKLDSINPISLINEETNNNEIEISDNISSSNGGGIFVQTTYQASIYDGVLKGNKSLGGNFGGGAIYVNGNDGYRNGRLNLNNVLIDNNTAKYTGGGIAGCPTSIVNNYYNEGSIIYNNSSESSDGKRKDDLSILTSKVIFNQFNGTKQSYDNINRFRLDKVPYLWRIVETDEIADENYLKSNNGKHLYASIINEENLDFSKVRVHIYNNTANTNGGGIGSNGDVYIGKENENDSFSINKNWVNKNNSENKPNNLNQINIWLFGVNGDNVYLVSKEVLFKKGSKDTNIITFNKFEVEDSTPLLAEEIILDDGTDIWTGENKELILLALDQLPDFNTENIIWTDSDKSPYNSKFEKTDEGNYELTNELQFSDLALTKEVIETSKVTDIPDLFKFKIELLDSNKNILTETFNYSISDREGQLKSGDEITLSKDETIIIKDIPIGTFYKITEEDVNCLVLPSNELEGVITKINGDNSLLIKNIYGRTGVLNIPVNKKITGSSNSEEEFKFEIKEEENYGNKVILPEERIITIKGEGNAQFNNIIFKEVGDYSFTVKEIKPEKESNYIYDESYFIVHVNVSDENKEDSLQVKASITKGEESTDEITFTNTYKEPLANFEISKSVISENNLDKNIEFDFTIKLSDETISGKYGDLEFYKGVANSVKLKHDNKISVSGLPKDVTYTITENNPNKFSSNFSNNTTSGKVEENKTNQHQFINTKNVGDLRVSKTVSGSDGDINKNFNFRVELSDKTITGQKNQMNFENGVAIFTLKHGEYKEATDLPVGITYTVTEIEADQDGYKTTFTNNTGTITPGCYINCTFENRKDGTGELDITKKVISTPTDNSTEFNFTVKLSQELTETYNGVSFVKGVTSFKLKNNETKKITGLPIGITYTVTEDKTEGFTITKRVGDSGKISTTVSTCEFENTKDVNNPENPEPEIIKEQSSKDYDRSEHPIISKLGDEITYYITVRNTTGKVMSNVTVTDEIPNGMTYIENSANYSVTVNNNLLTWTIDSLDIDESISLEFKVKVTETLDIFHFENQANLSYAESDNTIPSNTVIADTPILTLVKEQQTNDTDKTSNSFNFSPLDNITYTITVTNIGEADATSTVVSDEIPEGLEFVASTPVADMVGNVLTWDLGIIPPEEVITIDVIFRVSPGTPLNSSFRNVAYVSWYEYGLLDPTPSNPVESTVTPETNNSENNSSNNQDNNSPDNSNVDTNSPNTTNTEANNTENSVNKTANTSTSTTNTSSTSSSPKTGIDNLSIIFILVIILLIASVALYLKIKKNKEFKER